MNLHIWEIIAVAVGILLPLVFRSTRTLLAETFRHPGSKSVIVRDERTGAVHAEHEDRPRARA